MKFRVRAAGKRLEKSLAAAASRVAVARERLDRELADYEALLEARSSYDRPDTTKEGEAA